MPITVADCSSVPLDPGGVPAYTETFRYADMGWVGYAVLKFSESVQYLLRATSMDLNLSQDIEKPDVIDGRMDPSTYRLGPLISEGTLELPVVADSGDIGCPTDVQTEAAALINAIWCWGTARNNVGRPAATADMDLRYASQAAYTFTNSVVNTISFSVAQSEMVSWSINVYAQGRIVSPDYTTTPPLPMDIALAPARVLTWNDCSVTGYGGCDITGDYLFPSNQVRGFDFEANNNADRFFTLNGSLYPMDVNFGKRDITGTVTLLGISAALRDRALTNMNRFTSKDKIAVGLYVGNDQFDPGTGIFTSRDWINAGGSLDGSYPGLAIWGTVFQGVVFQIEEIAMTNEVLETTVNWHGLASDAGDIAGVSDGLYQAFMPTTSENFPLWAS